MRILLIFFILFLCSCSSQDKSRYRVICFLNELYWIEQRGTYSVDVIDDFYVRPDIISLAEQNLGYSLSGDELEEAYKLRKENSKNYTR